MTWRLPWWMISLADVTKPPGQQFIGCIYVLAATPGQALMACRETVYCPLVPVDVVIHECDPPPADCAYRVLGEAEMIARGLAEPVTRRGSRLIKRPPPTVQ